MKPYQQRVIEERTALEEKIERLDQFIGGDVFAMLSDYEMSLLIIQMDLMKGLSSCLAARIEIFKFEEEQKQSVHKIPDYQKWLDGEEQ